MKTEKRAERKKGKVMEKQAREREEGRREWRKGKMEGGQVAVSVQIWHHIASLCSLQQHRAVQLIVS